MVKRKKPRRRRRKTNLRRRQRKVKSRGNSKSKAKRIKNQAKFINELITAPTAKDRTGLIAGAGPRQLNALSEVTKNVYYGKIPLKSACKKKLCRYQNVLKQLFRKSLSNDRKRAIWQDKSQKGGFVPLSIILPSLVGLVTSLLK
jgi:hypothetical protein